MTQSRDPVALRSYLGFALADAQNPCELLACQIAIRLLEDKFPFLKRMVYDRPEPDEDLTAFLF